MGDAWQCGRPIHPCNHGEAGPLSQRAADHVVVVCTHPSRGVADCGSSKRNLREEEVVEETRQAPTSGCQRRFRQNEATTSDERGSGQGNSAQPCGWMRRHVSRVGLLKWKDRSRVACKGRLQGSLDQRGARQKAAIRFNDPWLIAADSDVHVAITFVRLSYVRDVPLDSMVGTAQGPAGNVKACMVRLHSQGA